MDAPRLRWGESGFGAFEHIVYPALRLLFAYSWLVSPANQCQLLRDQVQSRLNTEKQVLNRGEQAAPIPRSYKKVGALSLAT